MKDLIRIFVKRYGFFMENKPLAERLRPKTLDDYIGQQHLVGKGKVLRKMIESGVDNLYKKLCPKFDCH